MDMAHSATGEEKPAVANVMRGILIGAGRMGLTHMALFNLVTGFSIRWTVIEPSRVVRWGLGRTLPRRIIDGIEPAIPLARRTYDLAVVCSPTPAHAEAHQALSGVARKVFIEKPLAVPAPTPNTLCGYVMLHHPHHQRMRGVMGSLGAGTLKVSLRSNTVVSRNSGWRGRVATGGGVINEFGSHALSLVVDLLGPVAEFGIESSEVVHSIDAPDRAVLAGRSVRGVPFEVKLDWTDQATRKPAYAVRYERTQREVVEHDFFEYSDATGRSSIADLDTGLGHYLRGVEFTRQARHFLDNDEFSEALAVAVEVDRLLGDIRDRTR